MLWHSWATIVVGIIKLHLLFEVSAVDLVQFAFNGYFDLRYIWIQEHFVVSIVVLEKWHNNIGVLHCAGFWPGDLKHHDAPKDKVFAWQQTC